ncbi:MAG: hypothetical protein AVDCRST_MAG40-3359, partial [uncultured Gemmatimonadaceae bacterium]
CSRSAPGPPGRPVPAPAPRSRSSSPWPAARRP